MVLPSLALAAFSAGGRAEPFDEIGRSVQVLLPQREQRAQDLGFFAAETVRSVQTGCEAIGPGDPRRAPAVRSAGAASRCASRRSGWLTSRCCAATLARSRC